MFPRVIRVLASAAMALAMFLAAAGAAQAQVQSIDVYEFGTYRSAGGTEVGVTPKGIVRSQTSGIKQLEATRKVIGLLGVEFGFRYRTKGAREGALVPLTIVAKFPPPGVLGRSTQVPVQVDGYTQVTTAGKDDFLTWTFEMKSDLVPGIWTFEIWSDGKKLTEQSFEVILPPTS
jgi:Domain of unknown function (DUF3859)